ncbi:MAG: type II and III secretion system protein family protein [Methylocella sp.]
MGDVATPEGPAGGPKAGGLSWGWPRPLFVLAALLAMFAVPQLCGRAAAQTKGARFAAGNVELLTRLTLVLHKSRNLRLDVPFAVVEVADPDIADARAISDRQLVILGKKIGATNVLLYDAKRQLIGVVDVDVKLDTGSLGAKIREASGGKDIHVDDVNGKIVLRGDSGDSQTVERAMNVAAGLAPGGVVNALKVTTPQQVMLKVRFVEADRAATRNLGIRWAFFKQNGNLAGIVGAQRGSSLFNSSLFPASTSLGGVTTTTTSAGTTIATTTPSSVLDVVSGAGGVGSPFATIITQIVNTRFGSVDAVLSALEEQQVLRQLAEPDLVALSGETASFLAGGEYPIPVVASGSGALPTVTVVYKEFGVKLNFTPTVLSRGVISLKLNPEVSSIDETLAVSVGGVSVPGLLVRRAQTTVELRDGQSFAIAGLMQASSTRTLDQLPWLGTVPILGALFRSSQFQQNETELVVLVTPYLIKPVPPGKQLKTPLDSSLAANDLDFFLYGRPEVAKTPPALVNGQGQVQSIAGAIAPGAPDIPPVAGVPVPAAVVAVPEPPAAVGVPVPAASEPVPQGGGFPRYDPATGYFIDPPGHGGGQ